MQGFPPPFKRVPSRPDLCRGGPVQRSTSLAPGLRALRSTTQPMRALPSESQSRRAGQRRTPPSGEVAELSHLTPPAKASIAVLVVDDERTLRESCVSVLEYEGYRVSLCSQGEE